jgi:hypothetical protein
MLHRGLPVAIALLLLACGGAQAGADVPDDDPVACQGKKEGDACTEPDGDPGACKPGKDTPTLVCDDDDVGKP